MTLWFCSLKIWFIRVPETAHYNKKFVQELFQFLLGTLWYWHYKCWPPSLDVAPLAIISISGIRRNHLSFLYVHKSRLSAHLVEVVKIASRCYTVQVSSTSRWRKTKKKSTSVYGKSICLFCYCLSRYPQRCQPTYNLPFRQNRGAVHLGRLARVPFNLEDKHTLRRKTEAVRNTNTHVYAQTLHFEALLMALIQRREWAIAMVYINCVAQS